MNKLCRACGGEFTPTPNQIKSSDWLCVPCRRLSQKQYRLARKASGNPVRSMKMPREWHRRYEATYYSDPAHKARRAAQMRGYAADPNLRHKHKARRMVRHAVASGQIQASACEVCGDTAVQAHHDDYSRPLDVRWLCRVHHNVEHAKAKGQA